MISKKSPYLLFQLDFYDKIKYFKQPKRITPAGGHTMRIPYYDSAAVPILRARISFHFDSDRGNWRHPKRNSTQRCGDAE